MSLLSTILTFLRRKNDRHDPKIGSTGDVFADTVRDVEEEVAGGPPDDRSFHELQPSSESKTEKKELDRETRSHDTLDTEASSRDAEDVEKTALRRALRFETKRGYLDISGRGKPTWLRKIKNFIFQNDPDAVEEFIPHYRYLPILSGVVVPFSILLEIPGLTEHWYIRTQNDKIVETRSNTVILDVGLGVSMACGAIACICLILRFLEKRVKSMTIFAILALTVHDVINIIAVIVFGVEHRFNDGFTYGQSYWITVCSTVASTFVNATLIYDYYSTPDFAKSGSGLTRKQRSLVIIMMILFVWIALGALVYSFLIDLSYIDSLYFTVVSIETIGFGDINPVSSGGRVFAIIYNTIGIINIGVAISTMRDTVVESFQQAYRARVKKLKSWRERSNAARANRRARRVAVEQALKDAGLPVYVSAGNGRSKRMKLNSDGLTKEQLDKAMERASEMTRGRTGIAEEIQKPVPLKNPNARKEQANEMISELEATMEMNGGKADEDEFERYRNEVEKQETRKFWLQLVVSWTLFFTFWMVGSAVFMHTEKWTFGDALYFSYISFTTIGYGDFSPTSPTGRAFFVVWALLGVAAMTILISVLSEAYSSKYQNALHTSVFEKAAKSFRSRNGPRRQESTDSNVSVATMREVATTFPLDVIHAARTLHELVLYYTDTSNLLKPVPIALKKCLDEIAEAERMDDQLKKEVLEDSDARKTLFLMAYEKVLRDLLNQAELTIRAAAVEDREGTALEDFRGGEDELNEDIGEPPDDDNTSEKAIEREEGDISRRDYGEAENSRKHGQQDEDKRHQDETTR